MIVVVGVAFQFDGKEGSLVGVGLSLAGCIVVVKRPVFRMCVCGDTCDDSVNQPAYNNDESKRLLLVWRQCIRLDSKPFNI